MVQSAAARITEYLFIVVLQLDFIHQYGCRLGGAEGSWGGRYARVPPQLEGVTRGNGGGRHGTRTQSLPVEPAAHLRFTAKKIFGDILPGGVADSGGVLGKTAGKSR